MAEATRVVITGFGLVTSVGHTAAESAAAIRGGLSRFRLADEVPVPANLRRTEFQGAPVARVAGIDAAREGAARGLDLLVPAFREALALSRLPPASSASAVCRVWTPLTGDDAAARAAFLNETRARLSGAIAPSWATAGTGADGGHAAGLETLFGALEHLAANPKGAVLVGCVDSPSTGAALRGLHEAGMVKSALRPDGLVPGEAGAALVFETAATARLRRATAYASIEACGRGRDPHPAALGPSRGEGLTAAFRDAFKGADDAGRVGLVISDLNGQRWRSLEWGLTEGRVLAPGARRRFWHPADCVGDCGAAMGLLMVVCASLALSKGYADADRAAVAASDAGGACRVVCLDRVAGPQAVA